jgi:hypothetical protein
MGIRHFALVCLTACFLGASLPAWAHVNPVADVNRELITASAHGQLWRVRALVEGGGNVNWRDEEGYTPMTWAAQRGHIQVVEYLLSRYAAVNPADRSGYTPLMWAAQEGHVGVVELLLRRGANPYVTDKRGANALNLARAAGHERVYAILREATQAGYAATGSPHAAFPMAFSPWGGAVPGYPQLAFPSAFPPPATPPFVAPPIYETYQTKPLNKDHSATVAKRSWAISRMADESYRFRADFSSYVQATATHLGWDALGTLNDPDIEVGKYLNAMYANLMKGRDLARARRDLGRAKNIQDARGESLFSRYVIEADRILRDAGW